MPVTFLLRLLAQPLPDFEVLLRLGRRLRLLRGGFLVGPTLGVKPRRRVWDLRRVAAFKLPRPLRLSKTLGQLLDGGTLLASFGKRLLRLLA